MLAKHLHDAMTDPYNEELMAKRIADIRQQILDCNEAQLLLLYNAIVAISDTDYAIIADLALCTFLPLLKQRLQEIKCAESF